VARQKIDNRYCRDPWHYTPPTLPACPLSHEPGECHRTGIGLRFNAYYFECEASDHSLTVTVPPNTSQSALVEKVRRLAAPPLDPTVVAVLEAAEAHFKDGHKRGELSDAIRVYVAAGRPGRGGVR
jgi:hypothetical protein